jgi:uncharacterized membrane protein YgcG
MSSWIDEHPGMHVANDAAAAASQPPQPEVSSVVHRDGTTVTTTTVQEGSGAESTTTMVTLPNGAHLTTVTVRGTDETTTTIVSTDGTTHETTTVPGQPTRTVVWAVDGQVCRLPRTPETPPEQEPAPLAEGQDGSGDEVDAISCKLSAIKANLGRMDVPGDGMPSGMPDGMPMPSPTKYRARAQHRRVSGRLPPPLSVRELALKPYSYRPGVRVGRRGHCAWAAAAAAARWREAADANALPHQVPRPNAAPAEGGGGGGGSGCDRGGGGGVSGGGGGGGGCCPAGILECGEGVGGGPGVVNAVVIGRVGGGVGCASLAQARQLPPRAIAAPVHRPWAWTTIQLTR